MTLRELLKDQKLPCKVIPPLYMSGRIYTVLYFDKKIVMGIDDQDLTWSAFSDAEDFKLYTEPKKLVKKKMYQAITVFKQRDKKDQNVPSYLYWTKEEALAEDRAIGIQEIEVEVYE